MGNASSTEHSTEADFKICVNASTDASKSFIEAHGSVETEVFQEDLALFHIENLKFAANKLPRDDSLKGYMLFDAYTRNVSADNCPENSELSDWRSTRKRIRAVNTDIVKLSAEAVSIANRKFANNSAVRAKYNVGVTHEEQHSVTTTWSTKIDVNMDLRIDYKILADSTSAISFQSSWGKEYQQTKTTTIGSQTGVEVDLDPGQVVVAKLRVTRYTMEVRVTFEVSLHGDIGCVYETWSFSNPVRRVKADINDVLRACNQPVTFTTSEVLKISFCTDGEVLLTS